MKVRSLEESVYRYDRGSPIGGVFAYFEGRPTGDEERDRKWVLGYLRAYSLDHVRRAIELGQGYRRQDRWWLLAETFGLIR